MELPRLSKKRIAVTGASGFLGKALVRTLEASGCTVVAAPRSRDYDLVDGEAVRRFIADARPEVIFHLAANVGGIGANRRQPATFFYENLMMGVQLLHESWKAGVEKVVAVATVCAYPKLAPIPFREDDLWNGYPEETNAPYGLAKKMLLVQAQAYRQQHGFNSVVLFPVNLYGPGDNVDLENSHVIPAMIRKFATAVRQRESEVVLWGDGSPTREFLYVEDAAEGILLAGEDYDLPDPVNLGSGREIGIRELAERIRALTGFAGKIAWDTQKPNGQPRRQLDVRRAEHHFGFRARTSLEDGLEKTVAWFLKEARINDASASR